MQGWTSDDDMVEFNNNALEELFVELKMVELVESLVFSSDRNKESIEQMYSEFVIYCLRASET